MYMYIFVRVHIYAIITSHNRWIGMKSMLRGVKRPCLFRHLPAIGTLPFHPTAWFLHVFACVLCGVIRHTYIFRARERHHYTHTHTHTHAHTHTHITHTLSLSHTHTRIYIYIYNTRIYIYIYIYRFQVFRLELECIVCMYITM